MADKRLVVAFEIDSSKFEGGARAIRSKLKEIGVEASVADKATVKLERSVREQERAWSRLSERLDPAIRRQREYANAVETLNRRLSQGQLSQTEHARFLGLAKDRYEQVGRAGSALASSLPRYMAAAFSVGAITNFARSLVDAELKMQAIGRRFRVAFSGDEGKASAGLGFARETSAAFGLDFEATAQGLSRLAAAARGTTLEGAGVQKVFLGISKAAAAMSLSSEETTGALRAVEQMISKGTVQAEELRGQLGERLPGAFQLAARAMGVTTEELGDTLRRGEVLASDLLPRLAIELENTFGPEAAKNVDSLQGSINALKTSWFEFKAELADSEALASFVNAIRTLVGWLDAWFEAHRRIVEWMQSLQSGPWGTGAKSAAGASSPSGVSVSATRRYAGPGVDPRETNGVDAMTAALVKSGDAYRNARAEAERFRREVESLINRLDPFGAKLAEINRQEEMLSKVQAKSAEQALALSIAVRNLAAERQNLLEQGAIPFELLPTSGGLGGLSELAGGIGSGGKLTILATEWEQTLDAIYASAATNFTEGVRYSLEQLFYDFDFSNFAENMEQVLRRTLAQLFADLAVEFGKELVKQTAKGSAAGSATGGGGWMSLLKGAGISTSALIGTAAVGALVAYGIYAQKKRTEEMRQQAYGGYASATSPGRGPHGADLSAALRDMLDALREATGEYLPEFNRIAVQIRNDGKYFRAEFEGQLIGVFESWNEAAIAAFKAAFSRSSAAANGILNQVVQNYTGSDPAQLASNLREVSQIMRELSGQSDVEYRLRSISNEIKLFAQRLGELGVSVTDARKLTQEWTVSQFKDLRRQITGETETPQEDLARRKQEAALYNAQLAMYRAELLARKAYLEGRLSGTQIEGQIMQREIENWRGYLGARQKVAEVNVQILQAELAAINAALAALAGLDIDIGKLKISGGGFGKAVSKFGQLTERWREGVEQFREAVRAARYNQGTTALTERERLQGQFGDFNTLLASARSGNVAALEQLPAAYSSLLEIAKTYSGGGGGLGFLGLGDSFREFFNALEAMSLQFLDSPRPKKLRDQNVIFDERFHVTAERHVRETAAFRQQAANQGDAQISTSRRIENGISQTNALLGRMLTQQRLGAA